MYYCRCTTVKRQRSYEKSTHVIQKLKKMVTYSPFLFFIDADLGFHVGFVILPNTILNFEVNVDNYLLCLFSDLFIFSIISRVFIHCRDLASEHKLL